MSVLQVQELSFEIDGGVIVDVPSLSVEEGEVLALLGPNGAGKSTLLRILALLDSPAKGRVMLEGRRVDGLRGARLLDARRKIACVFHEPLLLDRSVRSNVELTLALRGVGRVQRRQKATEALELFKIAHLAERRPHTLSGGEAQRASLARAFAISPKVILLDEPFSKLDEPTRKQLTSEFADVLRSRRITAVFVTHDRTEALAISDRIAVMIDGRLRQVGRPADLSHAPADAEVAAFLGFENVFEGEVVRCSDGLVRVQTEEGVEIDAVGGARVGSRAVVLLRPEDVAIELQGQRKPPSSARNRFAGRVVALVPQGFTMRVELDVGFRLRAVVTAQSAGEMRLEAGVPVSAVFKASAVRMFAHD